MKEVDYTQFLTDQDKIRIYFKQQRGRIVKFIIQYHSFINGEWRSIVRCDTCHGYPHLHTYHLQKRENVVRLKDSNNEVFTQFKTYVIKNFRGIKENFTFGK